MNHIHAKSYKSKFATGEHLGVFVDNVSLDRFLESHFKHDYLLELVPALTWLLDPKDRALAESLLITDESTQHVAPILVCPDDQDFHCTTVVAEAEFTEKLVIWRRFGLCKTCERGEISNPKNTEWFEPGLELTFEKSEYLLCFEALRHEANEGA